MFDILCQEKVNFTQCRKLTVVTARNLWETKLTMSKLLSGWRNKFSMASKGARYGKKYGKIIEKYMTDGMYHDPGYAAPFTPFVSFVAHEPWKTPKFMNTHWKPQFDRRGLLIKVKLFGYLQVK